MTKKELIEELSIYPDDAIIYIEADHGQLPEQVDNIFVTKDEELPYTSEDIAWRGLDEVKKIDQVTAIKIG